MHLKKTIKQSDPTRLVSTKTNTLMCGAKLAATKTKVIQQEQTIQQDKREEGKTRRYLFIQFSPNLTYVYRRDQISNSLSMSSFQRETKRLQEIKFHS